MTSFVWADASDAPLFPQFCNLLFHSSLGNSDHLCYVSCCQSGIGF